MTARTTIRPRLTPRTTAAGLLLLALLPPLCGQTASTKPAKLANPPIISLPEMSLPTAYLNYPFHIDIPVLGGSGNSRLYLFGDTPPGLELTNFANSLAIDGVPTASGSYTIQLIATDADGTSAHHDYPLNIFANRPIPLIGPASNSDTEAFSFSDSVKLIFGIQPSYTEAFSFSDTVSIIASVQLTPTTTPSGIYNTAYSQTFTAYANVGSVSFTPSGTLPTGMSFSTTSSTIKLSGTPTQTGTFPFTITVKDTVNTTVASYSLVIAQASQTITPGTLPTPTYGQANFSLAATASSGLPVTYAVLSGPATGTNPFVPTGAGTVQIQISQSGNSNYLAAPSQTVSVTIYSALLKVIPNALSRAFDQPNPTTDTYTLSGLVHGDTASIVSGSPSAYFIYPPPLTTAGTYGSAIGANVTSMYAPNYSVVTGSGSLTITQAPQYITFYALPKLASGGTTFPLTASASSGLAVTYSVTGPANISNNILTVYGAGTITVTASQAGNTNYSAATSVVRSFTAQ
jgi:hypothetical protein